MDSVNFNSELLKVIPNFQNDVAEILDGWIYLGDNNQRYVLGELGQKNMLIFGINPSSARPAQPDPTIRKVCKILENNGYDGWIMMNIYPQRTVDPKALTKNETLIKNNLEVLNFVLDNLSVSAVWCAWGNDIDELPAVRELLKQSWEQITSVLEAKNLTCLHYGKLTNKGNPRHPLYVAYSSQFYPMTKSAVSTDTANIMLGVPVGDTCEKNMEFNLYTDAKKNVYGYLGLYKDKKICAVGKVIKVVKVETVNGELKYNPEPTYDEKRRYEEFSKHSINPNSPVADSKDRIFFVDNFYRTNYKNVGTMGIMGGKKFLLDKLLPATTEEIAEQLDGQTWNLEKGKDIIPEKIF